MTDRPEEFVPRPTGSGSLMRLAWWAVAATFLVTVALVVTPWMGLLTTSGVFHRAVVAFLTVLPYVYLAAVACAGCGSVLLGGLLLRARKRGAPGIGLARGLLLCGSALLVAAVAEGMTAAAGWLHDRNASRSMAATGLPQDFSLPTHFPTARPDDEVCLVVLGESSAEGYPCHDWLSVGRVVAWQLGRSIPSRRFHAEILAHAGDTLESQHRKLAELKRRPDAIIVYCGHNEFAARYPTHRDFGYYQDPAPSDSHQVFWDRISAQSALCRLMKKLADVHRVGIAPASGLVRPLIDTPAYTAAEYATRIADFRRRLEIIVAYCNELGALPVLVVPPANDADFEPNRSFLAASTPRAEREAVTRTFLAARGEEEAQPAESMECYRQLLERHPEFAEAHFRLARLLERAGQFEEASTHYAAARDHDGIPIRAPNALHRAYHDVAGARGAILIDGQRLFQEIGQLGLLDDWLFLDAMHPTVRGHIALAQAILDAFRVRRAFGWPADGGTSRIDPLGCVAHFGIDAAAWKTLCERGAMFYYGFGSTRYESAERQAKLQVFREAARRIAGGEAPEAVGLPSIGMAAERASTGTSPPGS